MYHFNRWLHCNKYLILSYLKMYIAVAMTLTFDPVTLKISSVHAMWIWQ